MRIARAKKGIPDILKLGDLDGWKSKLRIEKRRANNQHIALLYITKEEYFRNDASPTLPAVKSTHPQFFSGNNFISVRNYVCQESLGYQ